MKIYFKTQKVCFPPNIFYHRGNHFNLYLYLFIASGHNNGIQFGFVNPFNRDWYNITLVYNRFRRKNG